MINEEENDLLGSVQFSFSFLSRELHHALKSMSHRSPDGYKATEILAAVNKLSISDDNKSKIVASGALKGYVAMLCSSCTTEEQFLAAQGLWTLAMKCPADVCNQANCVKGECTAGVLHECVTGCTALHIVSFVWIGSTLSVNQSIRLL